MHVERDGQLHSSDIAERLRLGCIFASSKYQHSRQSTVAAGHLRSAEISTTTASTSITTRRYAQAIVMLDVDSFGSAEEVDWLLARCTESDTFVDLRTRTQVPASRNLLVHGRAVRELLWISLEEAAPPSPETSIPDHTWVRGLERVTLTGPDGAEVQQAFHASTSLYDSMGPRCPHGEWVVFQAGKGAPGDVVMANVEQTCRKPVFRFHDVLGDRPAGSR